MKFSTRAGDLDEALTLAGKVIPKSPSLAVYSGVKLAIAGNKLSVSGSDEGNTTVTVNVPVTDAAAGNVVLLPKPLGSYLHTLAAGTQVTVTSDDKTKVTVAIEGGTPYTFRTMDATFPTTASAGSDAAAVDLHRFNAAVASVKHCARKNKIVQLVSDDRGLRLHATDNTRLTRAYLPEASFGAFSGLLPLPVLEQIADSNITHMTVDRRGRVLTATGERISIVTRLVDEMFPTVDSILDNVPTYRVQVKVAALRSALNRLMSVAEGSRPLLVRIAGDEIKLHMDSVNLGSGVESISLDEQASGDVDFGINMEFLSECVSAHTGGEVTVGWTAAELPIFLSSAEPFAVTNVIMPIKLT